MIEDFGWSQALQDAFAPHRARGWTPARVIAAHRDLWRIVAPFGEANARLTGRFAHHEANRPIVGDWVAVEPTTGDAALIHALGPRVSALTRRDPGGGAQALVANVDVALIAASLNADFNLRRLERYLVLARDGGVRPVIVLTKADLSRDAAALTSAVAAIAGDAAVIVVSALRGEGLDAARAQLAPGATAALLGSSGVGKSTLINALAGRDLMRTGAIRADDDRGRHTTTHRELVRLPWGALVIDTPGLRELGLIADDAALGASFADVAALARGCRFADCSHEREPGCAVRAALESGALDAARWRGFQKLQREIAYSERRDDPIAEAAERDRWKRIHKNARQRIKHKRRLED